MKYIYVSGLEHSGSTLITHLLSQCEDVIGLGEVARFLSPEHMRQYLAQWGDYSDARLCSCKEEWEKCAFWGDVIEISGLNSDGPLVEKYGRLFQYIKARHPQKKIVVDSSKGFGYLRQLIEGRRELGLEKNDILVVLAVKDVHSFSTSIAKKSGARGTLLSHVKTFNRWLGENRRQLEYLTAHGIPFKVVLYEKLCSDPKAFVSSLLEGFSSRLDSDPEVRHNNSHIALGNKNFIMRNRDKINYDYRWFLEDGVNWVYLIHRKARRFNKNLYAL